MAWPRHQAVMHELEVMTDRELADIGLTRGAIPRSPYVRRLTGSGQRNRSAT
jgi:uncharacterized protein YjiS (DUF1127 family)